MEESGGKGERGEIESEWTEGGREGRREEGGKEGRRERRREGRKEGGGREGGKEGLIRTYICMYSVGSFRTKE